MRHFSFCLLSIVILFGAQAALADTAIQVTVLSATVRDQAVDGASVTLQRNGEQSFAGVSNASGVSRLSAPFSDDSSTVLIVSKPGYADLVAKCPCSGLTFAISPIMSDLDGARIVLTWGAQPKDLDAHLQFPGAHVWYLSKEAHGAHLDVDAKNGFGPETITIDHRQSGQRYVYAVYDYSAYNNPPKSVLSASGAKVYLYVGQTLVRTYSVPTGQPGNLWAVFAINEGGEIVDISSIKSVTACVESTGKTAVMKDATTCAGSDSDILGVLGGLAEYLPGAVRPDVPSSNEAVAINRRGEMAYRAGRTNDAIQLFRLAADIDPQFGQAYSNLGLAFQKAGRIAEALWANRQAIQLAEGARAGTVRANAHYNNGRIYEGAGQFPDALREYRQAESEKSSAAYDEAIGRMSEKLHVPSASER